ncbi:MAG: 3-isopropylmalate dehydratase small subunit [Pseudomonadota bacterium]
MFNPTRSIVSRTIALPPENIDTDQIIPARFLTTTSREGLGKSAFFDWRYNAEGRLRNDSPLDGFNPDEFQILVAGANFGCGSSREHAPWALADFGFRAVISSQIADIFKSNALKNGLLAVEVDPKTHRRLLQSPGETVVIDVESQTLALDDGWQAVFELEPFARHCLLNGVDPLGHLLAQSADISAFEARRA